jgi:hypothetical protein
MGESGSSTPGLPWLCFYSSQITFNIFPKIVDDIFAKIGEEPWTTKKRKIILARIFQNLRID